MSAAAGFEALNLGSFVDCCANCGNNTGLLFTNPCHFHLVSAAAGFKPLNLGSLVGCCANCGNNTGLLFTKPCHFHLLSAAEGFKPLNLGSLVYCFVNSATSFCFKNHKNMPFSHGVSGCSTNFGTTDLVFTKCFCASSNWIQTLELGIISWFFFQSCYYCWPCIHKNASFTWCQKHKDSNP